MRCHRLNSCDGFYLFLPEHRLSQGRRSLCVLRAIEVAECSLNGREQRRRQLRSAAWSAVWYQLVQVFVLPATPEVLEESLGQTPALNVSFWRLGLVARVWCDDWL